MTHYTPGGYTRHADRVAHQHARIELLRRGIVSTLKQAEAYEPGPIRDRYIEKANLWAEELRVLQNQHARDDVRWIHVALLWLVVLVAAFLVFA